MVSMEWILFVWLISNLVQTNHLLLTRPFHSETKQFLEKLNWILSPNGETKIILVSIGSESTEIYTEFPIFLTLYMIQISRLYSQTSYSSIRITCNLLVLFELSPIFSSITMPKIVQLLELIIRGWYLFQQTATFQEQLYQNLAPKTLIGSL